MQTYTQTYKNTKNIQTYAKICKKYAKNIYKYVHTHKNIYKKYNKNKKNNYTHTKQANLYKHIHNICNHIQKHMQTYTKI